MKRINQYKLCLLLGVCLTMLLTLIPLFTACTSAPPNGGATVTVTKTTTATTTATTSATGQVINWKMQTLNPQSTPFIEYLRDVTIPNIEKMTEGQLQIELYESGALVPVPDVFTAVGEGTLDIAINTPVYAVSLVGDIGNVLYGVPYSVTESKEMHVVGRDLGLDDIFREATAEYNVYWMDSACGCENPIFSTRPLRTLDDFQGLKIRTLPWVASILEAAGAAPTYVSGSEIYSALATGVIDATTWGGLAQCELIGLHENTQYICYPAPVQMSCMDCIVNLGEWEALPERIQLILQNAITDWAGYMERWNYREDALSYQRLTTEYGMEVCWLDDEAVEFCAGQIRGILEEAAAADPVYAAPAIELFIDYMEELGRF